MDPIYLITPTQVFDATGQNPDLMEGSQYSIEGAILRATIKLEGVLRTPLGLEHREDTFYISGLEGAPLNKRYTLRLSNGFVREDYPIQVSVCDSFDGAYLPMATSMLFPELGKVSVPTSITDDLLGKYLKVVYKSGFSSPLEIPEEVRQALLCYVPLMLLSSSVAIADPKQQAAIVAKATSIDSIGSDMVAKYHRPIANSIKPMYSRLCS